MQWNALGRLRRDGTARSVGAFFALCALLLQVAVPLAHDPSGIGTFTPWLDVPLCHAGNAPANSPAGDQGPAGAASHLCPLCFALQACGTYVAPAAAPAVTTAVPVASPVTLPVPVHVARTARLTPQSRAPPAA
jgi:hypothetical protein